MIVKAKTCGPRRHPRGRVVLGALVLALVGVSARAADCEGDPSRSEGYVTRYSPGTNESPRIQRAGAATDMQIRSGSCLEARDRIVVPSDATVEILTRSEPGGHVLKHRDSPYEISIGSPLPKSPWFLASLRQAISHVAKDFPVAGGVNPSKGAGDCDSRKGGFPLHAAAALSNPGQVVSDARTEVSIAWLGGVAPYHVRVTRDGKVVAELTECSGMVAELPIGDGRAKSVQITVSDEAKASIGWSLTFSSTVNGTVVASNRPSSDSEANPSEDQLEFESALADLLGTDASRRIEGFTLLNRLSEKYFPALMLVRAVAGEVPLK